LTAPAESSPRALRKRIRAGWSGLTTGHAPGFLQGNLVVLSREWAEPFVAFCRANPQPLPLLGASKPGDAGIPALAADLDLRTDVGRYRVYRNGALHEERTDIAALWRDDWVAIVLGCWFSNEAAIAAAGIRMRHVELGIQGGLFRTTRPCVASGPYACDLVVSMRPFAAGAVERVAEITSGNPAAHGAPVQVGNPAALGIRDLAAPDFGESLPPQEGEVPVYWGCGLTAIAALEAARPPIAVTHSPGCMVVTDLRARGA
jgi:uncharacterized protein YcsI (UPF0317 family)